jgi:hypothetical protein
MQNQDRRFNPSGQSLTTTAMTAYPTNDQLRRIAMEARDAAGPAAHGKRFMVIVDDQQHERQTVPALVKFLSGCVADWDSIKPFRNWNDQACINLDA